MKKFLKENWYVLATTLLLLGALGDWPYGYYQLLRWVVCGVGAYGAYIAFNTERHAWALILGGIAVLFNPFFPFFLERSTWQIIDLLTAGIFIRTIFSKVWRG